MLGAGKQTKKSMLRHWYDLERDSIPENTKCYQCEEIASVSTHPEQVRKSSLQWFTVNKGNLLAWLLFRTENIQGKKKKKSRYGAFCIMLTHLQRNHTLMSSKYQVQTYKALKYMGKVKKSISKAII